MNQWINAMVDLLIQYGALGLFIVSFAESSFFPIPPDLILIPLSIINHRLAMAYAALTTLSSVLGGLFGYYIGAKAGRPLLKRFFREDRIRKVNEYFDKYGGWAVAIAGLTPIPYKVFTIASGVFRIKKSIFVNASIIGRGIRFFTEGLIIYLMGDNAQKIIVKYFDVLTIGITLLAIIFYFIYTYTKNKLKKEKHKASGIISIKNSIKKHMNYFYNSALKGLGKRVFLTISAFIVLTAFFFVIIETFEANKFILYLYIMAIVLMAAYFINFFSLSNKEYYFESYRAFIRRIIVLECILLALFGSLVYGFLNNDVYYMDNIIGQWMLRFYNNFNTSLMIVISFFASAKFLIFAMGIIFFYLMFRVKKNKPALIFMMNLVGASLIKMGIKNFFKRPRPEIIFFIEKEYSFPSGHSFIGFAFYGLLSYYIYKYYNGSFKRVITSFLILFPLVIGISRIYLAVHYASDVFAGFFLGGFWLLVCISIDKYYDMKAI